MIERSLQIATAAGSTDSFVCHPERGGPFPAIVFYMDAPGIREELYDMVRRLAAVGYFVVLPNLYYRHGRGTACEPACTEDGSAAQKRMFELMLSLSNPMVAEDTAGILAFIDAQPEAKRGRLGAVGYCMSGPFAVTAAARFPDRFAAAASLHGVPMVTDKPDSPHRVVGDVRAELYLGFGEKDPLTPAADVEAMREALRSTRVRHEVEVYPRATHGFVFPGRGGCYDKPSAERHWERLFALFRRNLG